MTELRSRLGAIPLLSSDGEHEGGCGCDLAVDDGTLVIDATGCDGRGRLATNADCRRTVIDFLGDCDVDAVRVETAGRLRRYGTGTCERLRVAGRFAASVAIHDARLAERTRADPIAACREAGGRAGSVARTAKRTGFLDAWGEVSSYETALAGRSGPTISEWQVESAPPPAGRLQAVYDLGTGATVRRYGLPDSPDRYFLLPIEHDFDEASMRILDRAYGTLARGDIEGGDSAVGRAVRETVKARETADVPVEHLQRALEKHANGHGLLVDLFGDPAVSDVFVSAPAPANRIRVTVDGEQLVTNLRLTETGIEGLASRFRRESGRAFSRADPTLDASTTIGDRKVRVAGVTEPTSQGAGFAFRAQDGEPFTLPELVGNDTLTPAAAALLSLAVERGGAILTAGPRGAGKTTVLGAMLWELPPTVRTLVIEDTPELPVTSLQQAGRDVQALLASANGDELSIEEALRTALRLGDGALAVGEVRGPEAAVLYEAMRVGANSEAVLGTIHGDGGQAVFERVVSDLGVPTSSFGVTDLIVTCEITGDNRRIAAIEEVVGGREPTFEALFDRTGEGLEPTGRIDRGNSQLVDSLARPEESYADVRDRLARRRRLIDSLATRSITEPGAVSGGVDSNLPGVGARSISSDNV